MIQTLFGSHDENQQPSILDRMNEAVTRTRENLTDRIEEVVAFGKEIDRATLDDLEATLIGADLGTATTHEVLGRLREKADRKQIKNVDELKRLLKEELLGILTSANSQPVQKVDGTPEVILVVGVNGTGKTTTIGKLAEVEKMRRTAQRIIPGAPHETLLVMDATTGQNGLQQARLFTESAGVTGIVLAKLDGTAKGGVVVAISRELGVPVRYVGVGEKPGDLLPFDAKDFVDSLFA